MMHKLMGHTLTYFKDLRYGQHAVKVFAYTWGIGQEEGLSQEDQTILQAAALIHDIGIPEALKIHGKSTGPYQEAEGARLAPRLLAQGEVDPRLWDRISWLVGHHHTEDLAAQDLLLQILMEADYLVNMAEGRHPELDPKTVRDSFFRTQAGICYLNGLYNLEP